MSMLRKQMALYELMTPGWFDFRAAVLTNGDGPDFIQITERTHVFGIESIDRVQMHHDCERHDKEDLLFLSGFVLSSARLV
ncbi:hypothetical protein QR680_006657 [Steinernema hermaphroditum]|uniref:Uncharacterized protein n=1 Tax=Steinernema hermaphroditum TaxID=289476 RepID=A0AA39LXR9_9BILA|nr:hypothetical protein QR680_006657 [Steinernema hermaphroditum]